jgi:ABC-type sugar transport system ATPase subunit
VSQTPLSKASESLEETHLQQQIDLLTAEVEKIQGEISAFERAIHVRLDREISRVQELKEIYKEQKKAKKAKRLEQKKRGKNYQEPTQVKHQPIPQESGISISSESRLQLKRLYKEAIVKFHPDKINHTGEEEKILRATAITARLNEIYQKGDLDELMDFYQSVILGESIATGNPTERKVDSESRKASLEKKKAQLITRLEQLKSNYFYTILQTYPNPLDFIDELYLQFRERIVVLEKRTKKYQVRSCKG